jgi:hypothetical protein
VPDISLLQNDLEVETEESRIPSFFLTVSMTLLIISIGAYIGLYFYVSTLKGALDQSVLAIKNLSLKNTSNVVEKLNGAEGQLAVLKELRIVHSDASIFLDVLANSVHPRVFYKNASFDLKNKLIEVDGLAANSSSLSKQVIIYFKDEKIDEYSISDVSLDGFDGIGFRAKLKVK